MRIDVKVIMITAWLMVGLLLVPVEAMAWILQNPANNSSYTKAANIGGGGVGNAGDSGTFYFGHRDSGTRVAENSIGFNVPTPGYSPAYWSTTLAPPAGAGNVWSVGNNREAWVNGALQQEDESTGITITNI